MNKELVREKLQSCREAWIAANDFFTNPTEREKHCANTNAEVVAIVNRVILGFYGYSLKDLAVKSRKREIVFPRQLAQYCLEKFTYLSLTKIGEMFGGRDHTTIINSRETVLDLQDQEPYGYEIAMVVKCITEAIVSKQIDIPARRVTPKRKKRSDTAIIKFVTAPVIPLVRPEAKYSNSGHLELMEKLK